MSFNIRYGTAQDGPNAWRYRRKLVIERIKHYSPDILGLQECRNDHQAQYLKRCLPEYDLYGVERGGQGEASIEMAPILAKRDRFKILDWGYFWLSETPDIPGSMSWGSVLPRTVTWVRIENRELSADTLTFVNAHFDHFSKTAIRKSARQLRDYLTGLGEDMPVILTGDFNCTKDSPAYRILRSAEKSQLQDALRINGSGLDEGTFHEFGQLNEPLSIDWLLVSRHFQVIESGIDRYHKAALFPSDHYPAYAMVSRI
jgi:endonuclease/exonuclease/phosphatase family metal-dependent hydrolase